ncbi:MAG: DUF2867 domain-containing protein [Methyloligellaceae bacterium]
MKIIEHPVQLPHSAFLEATWGDKFQLSTTNRFDSAYAAAEQMIGTQPAWLNMLLKTRDVIVSPFGLKTMKDISATKTKMVGIFPVLKETENQLIAGADDKHLNFRLVINRKQNDNQTLISVTTLVKINNVLGKAYLTTIMPFHRFIVQHSLRSIG